MNAKYEQHNDCAS